MEETGALILQVLLLSILFLGLLVEFKTGGLGVGAMLGLTAAGVFFGSRYVQGLVSMVQIGIFLAGVLCIVIEMLAPTVGLLAGLGVAAMLYSVVFALGGTMNAVGSLVAAIVIALLVFVLIVKRLPSSKLWRHLVLHDSTTTESGYVSAETRAELVGCTGRAETELRPSGRAVVAGQPVDVVSEGAFIGKGTPIVVVSASGSRVVVRAMG